MTTRRAPGPAHPVLPGWSFRLTDSADVPEVLVLQERGALAGLSNVFPQERYPFPRGVVRERWEHELEGSRVVAYVAVADRRLAGFGVRRGDELLHFGTALETWGSGLAIWLHDELIATYPRDVSRVRLRVFAENRRARRFYEKLGWRPTGAESRTSFAPHPTLLEYTIDRSAVHS